MHFEPCGARKFDGCDDALPLGLRLAGVAVDDGVTPGTGMDFDDGRLQLAVRRR